MPSKPKYLTRRVLFQRAATSAVGVAIACGLGLNRAVAQPKVPQKAVMYQEQPQGTQRCDGCTSFQPPDGCKLVDGKINPQGWCSLFMKKT